MSYLLHRQTLQCALLAITLCTTHRLRAEETAAPLHSRIDALLEQSQFGPVAATADDSAFLRRVYLDLIGRIPTRQESEAFLADQNPQKREALVDNLLARPDFARHLAVVFDVMLMERRGGKHVKSEDFRNYLEQSFAAGKSYLQIVQEVLGADGTDEKTRAAAAFYLERDVEPNLLTREVGRVFFGMDLQCAQCHNHPNIEDYDQEDYYGLQAFVLRASLFQPDKKKPALIAENAVGDASFQSVFTNRTSLTGPRIPGGEELVEVALKPGEQYQVAPAKNVRQIPQQSRIAKLAEVVATQPTAEFNRNIANRLWAHMFGRGLVHPVDLHHSGNPPTHPELLELISTEFAAANYAVKPFLRQLALSQAYQRAARMPMTKLSLAEAKQQIVELQKIAEQQLEQSYAADANVDAATEKVDAAFEELKPLRSEIDKANKAVADALKARDAAATKVAARQQEIAGRQAQLALVVAAHEKAQAAAEAIKDDQELAAATATILKRSEALQADVAKLQAAEKTEAEALAKAEEQLKATNVAADAAIAAAQPAEAKLRALRDEFIALRNVAEDHRMQSALSKQKVADLQSLVDYEELQLKIDALVQQIPTLEQSLKTGTVETPKLEKTVADTQAAVVAAQAAMKAAMQLVQNSQNQLAETQTTKSLLTESLKKLDEAAKRIESENGLAAAQSQIADSVRAMDEKLAMLQGDLTKQQGDLEAKTKATSASEVTLKAAQESLAKHVQTLKTLETQLQASRVDLDKSRLAQQNVQQAILDQSSSRANAGEIVALTPEQLGWSVLVASGQSERQRTAEAAKLAKEKPLSEEDQQNPAKVAEREAAIEQATYLSLSKTVDRFVQLFGAGSGQPQHEFFATADQALFFANGPEIRGWLSPAGGNLTDRLLKIEDPQQFANELYLSVLCRPATATEVQDVSDYLNKRPEEKSAVAQELAWALLTSAEFRFQF